MNKITQEEVKKHLSYNYKTGLFTRKPGVSYAGTKGTNGYVSIMINYKIYKAHRLAWLYIYGYLPENQIDHKNGIRDDNRLCNLREITQLCNNQNCKIYSNNKSGFPSVSFHQPNKKWKSSLGYNYKSIFLGLHETPIDAALARLTQEVWYPQWVCNHRSELIKKIMLAWPEFNLRSIE